MATVAVQLPSLLSPVVGGKLRFTLEAATLREALAALIAREPRLGVHLFDETGAFREHVLCFLNDTNSRWLDSLDVPVSDGDTLTILQAVSGG